tara:strand:- start:38 stop:1003 length:966 start_codon:yes stop_codon:yes gene_type:complete
MTEVNPLSSYFSTVGSFGVNPSSVRDFAEVVGEQKSSALDTGQQFATSFLSSSKSFSLSSFYKVRIDLAADSSQGTLERHLFQSGIYHGDNGLNQERFSLLATEAVLPGTSFATSTETGSRQGLIEKFAAQRTFNDIAVTYYLTGDYKSLIMFQEWINYINPLYASGHNVTNEEKVAGVEEFKSAVSADSTGYPEGRHLATNNFFRHRYPAQYKKTMSITKFERNIDTTPFESSYAPQALSYKFINVFPTSIQDVALSYAESQVLQITVNFAYDRYVMVRSDSLVGYSNESSPSNKTENNSQKLNVLDNDNSKEKVVTTAK